jgi:hypothetical protein
MANRKDMLPKQYGEAVCVLCQKIFSKIGPNEKRCLPCKREYKRKYERDNKRVKRTRHAACQDCGALFPPDVHAATKRCAPCAKAAHHALTMLGAPARHKRLWRDPGHRLHLSISVLVRRSLKSEKGWRSWRRLVGYDVRVLRHHLERQFLKGMTWENFGTAWHIDHILPRSSFKFSTADDRDFKACWALTNLRPLWADQNFRKSNKRTHLL